MITKKSNDPTEDCRELLHNYQFLFDVQLFDMDIIEAKKIELKLIDDRKKDAIEHKQNEISQVTLIINRRKKLLQKLDSEINTFYIGQLIESEITK